MRSEKNAVNTEIDRLTKLIQKELKKTERKVDMEKVKAYQAQIIELEHLTKTSEKELQAIALSLKTRVQTSPAKKSRFGGRSVLIKVSVCFLAVCITMFSAFSVMAISAGGFDKSWTDVVSFVSELIRLVPGTYQADGVTIVKGNHSERYDSVEVFLSEANLDILYPAALPEHIKLNEITLIEFEDHINVYFEFEDSDLSIAITKKRKPINDPEHLQIINERECYIYDYDGKYQATFYDDDREYIVCHADYEELIFVLSQMKPLIS